MSTTLDNIKELIPNLPKKDIDLGYGFLSTRNFESLQSLVDSALIKVRRSQASDTPREEYKDVDVEKLNILKAEVDAYCIPLGIGEPEDNFIENTDFING